MESIQGNSSSRGIKNTVVNIKTSFVICIVARKQTSFWIQGKYAALMQYVYL